MAAPPAERVRLGAGRERSLMVFTITPKVSSLIQPTGERTPGMSSNGRG
jgi:hypothetical protein